MFKEPRQQTASESRMDKLTVSVLSSKNTWFGVLVDGDDGLLASSFSRRKNPTERLVRIAENVSESKPRMVSHQYAEAMSRIFEGQEISHNVKYNPVLTTPFQMRVYEVLKRVPKSRVTTYGMIANAIDSGPRAVGTAVASNPWPLFVPCHRVVPFDFAVGNYSLNQRPDGEGTRTKEE